MLQWSLGTAESATTDSASNSNAAYAATDGKGQEVSSSILGSIYHKSRQSRCVTCYEDRLVRMALFLNKIKQLDFPYHFFRRYGDDRSRYYSSSPARSGDDRTGGTYYSGYDRYDDRGYRGSEYDRYGADRYGSDRYGTDRNRDRYVADRYGTDDRYGGYRYSFSFFLIKMF